jgi:FlaA1/EpsC-like NDP-sugar epimerase
MTASEAADLGIVAGALAEQGELFLLDMGEPVRILDLAESMIRLCGLEPYRDIDILEIGLRPGEKLYEELLVKGENLDKTANDMILAFRARPHSREEIADKLDILSRALASAEQELCSPLIVEALRPTVPEFCPSTNPNA